MINIALSFIGLFIGYRALSLAGHKSEAKKALIAIAVLITITILLAFEIVYAITGRECVDIDDIDEITYSTTYDLIEEEPVVEEPIIEVEGVHFDNEYDRMIYEATKDTIVDPYVAIAISRLETGHYTSSAFVSGNNFGGMTGSNGVMSFPSISNGLERYVAMLEWYYGRGMDTPSKMQKTYCPPNENWDDIVNRIYNELKQY